MIKYFIDFDDTIFDRSKFVADMFNIVKRYGFTDLELKNSYRKVYNDGYEGIWAHLEHLHSEERIFDVKSCKKEVNLLLKDTSKYLFVGVKSFLSKIDRNIYDPQILTVGGVQFQKEKVEGAGIRHFFSKCNFITTKKAIALEYLVDKDEVFVLLDDKAAELKFTREKFPRAILINSSKKNFLEYINPVCEK